MRCRTSVSAGGTGSSSSDNDNNDNRVSARLEAKQYKKDLLRKTRACQKRTEHRLKGGSDSKLSMFINTNELSESLMKTLLVFKSCGPRTRDFRANLSSRQSLKHPPPVIDPVIWGFVIRNRRTCLYRDGTTRSPTADLLLLCCYVLCADVYASKTPFRDVDYWKVRELTSL